MASGKPSSGFRLGERTDSWGGAAPETNPESVGREGPVLAEAEEMQMSKGSLKSSMPRRPQQQYQAQRKRADCCKRNYLNRFGWGKGKKKIKKKSRPALFGSKPSSLR